MWSTPLVILVARKKFKSANLRSDKYFTNLRGLYNHKELSIY